MTTFATQEPRLTPASATRSDGPTTSERIEWLVESLSSLHDADKAVPELIACGDDAVPALRQFLFKCEPSGIFEPRCWAVRALARIGASEVLIEFLGAEHDASDPVAWLGEEAVMNTAARALTSAPPEQAYEVLLKVARGHPLAGALEVLGEFRREEVVPILIRALEDDVARDAAEDALRKFDVRAGAALCNAAVRKLPDGNESPSSVRRRRSALRLLAEMRLAAGFWNQVQDLMDDANESIGATACIIAMDCGTEARKQCAVRSLIALLGTVDWLLRSDIEDTLTRHFGVARGAIRSPFGSEADPPSPRIRRSLARILARADAERERHA